jgi:hypothetical protein
MGLKEVGNYETFSPPPPLSAAELTVNSCVFPDSSSLGLASAPIGWSGQDIASQNGGDLYPYNDETGQKGIL